jgi:WD40 repeat protein
MAATTASANRKSDPRQLSRLIRGELDWIVMKALEKDRNRRYETASAFAADVQRYLNDEPVLACPPSAWYRIRKLVRRNPARTAAYGLLALVLVLGTGASGAAWLWQEAVAARWEAERERDGKEEQRLIAEGARASAEEARAGEARQRGLVDRLLYFSDVQLVQRAAESGEYGRMQELLDELGRGRGREADLPGFEYHYLRRQCRLLRTLRGQFVDVAWSPDGQRLATASGETVKVWDVVSEKEILTLKGHAGWNQVGVSWSPDGRHLASASWTWKQGEVRAWDISTGKELLTLPVPDRLHEICWSPDGKQIAGACGALPGPPAEARIWDARTGKLVLSLKGHTRAVLRVSWSRDGTRLATAGDETARVWDAKTGKEERQLRWGKGGMVGVSWSPDGQRLAACSWDGMVKVCKATTGKEELTFRGGTRILAWSPDGQRLASASLLDIRVWDTGTGKQVLTLKGRGAFGPLSWSPDGTRLASVSPGELRIWNFQEGLQALTLEGHILSAGALSWSPDGQRLASAGAQDPAVRVWDSRTGEEILTLEGHRRGVITVSWSPDGKHLASGGGGVVQKGKYLGGEVKVWDTTVRKEALTLNGHTGRVVAVVWSPDGTRLASTAFGHNPGMVWELKVWDKKTGKQALTFQAPLETRGWRNNHGVAWSPDGGRLASACGDAVRVWDTQTWKEEFALRAHTEAVSGLAWSADGRRLAAACGGALRVWNSQTGKEELTLRTHAPALNVSTWSVSAVSWSPDGRRLLCGGGDGSARVWDAKSGKEELILRGLHGDVAQVSWNPDGTRLAGASSQETVCVWDAQTGKEAAFLEGHTGLVSNVVWSPDGRRLASSSGDGTVRIWDGTGTPLPEPSRPSNPKIPRAIRLSPRFAAWTNALAWSRANILYPEPHHVRTAVALALHAVQSEPTRGDFWNTLGVAHYRAGNWKEAIAALEKSLKLQGDNSFDWFFLAMVQWRIGEKEKAHQWYDRAVQWMDKNQSSDTQLRRFRAEAAELLGRTEKKK